MVTFICWALAEAAGAAFLLALARKWGWIEWAQVHAESDFLYRLFSCEFCLTWWTCVAIAVVLWWPCGAWWPCLIPFVSTPIAKKLW